MGGWVGDGVGGWRVHGWVVVGWVVVGFMCGWWWGAWWGGWLESSWGGCITHSPMNSYNVKTFHFMNTQPPIKHIQSVTLSLYIYFGWFMGGRWVVGGFMGWVGGWVVEGFVEWVVVGWVAGGFMGWVGIWLSGWWWGGLLEGSWGGCIYSPTHEQLQC